MGRLTETLRRGLTPPLLQSTATKLWKLAATVDDLGRRVRSLQEAVGRIESRQTADAGPALREHEFKVYSQWGEDGILQHLCRHAKIPRRVFVEFGVESYQEANTRFLLVNDNWSGLVLDGDEAHVQRIRADRVYWLHNLKAQHAFVTAENINDLLTANGVTGEIGLLSIDVDGMDYWIWKAIEVITPAIVAIEYNHRFGPDEAIVVPYDPAFDRRKAHPSLNYYGASLRALCELGRAKGYAFVGCGSAGLNAFFVHRNAMTDALREVSVEEGFVAGQFCETHDAAGNRIKTTPEEEQAMLADLPLVRVGGGHEPERRA